MLFIYSADLNHGYKSIRKQMRINEKLYFFKDRPKNFSIEPENNTRLSRSLQQRFSFVIFTLQIMK